MLNERSLAGLTALVTGATAGIGLQTALMLARRAVNIIAVGRDPERNRQAEQRIRAVAPGISIQFILADLSLLSQVRDLARIAGTLLDNAGHPGIDILFNIAGVYSSRQLSSEGIEVTLAVNHLAPFLLSHELLPRLNKAQGQVITVSSKSHRFTWIRPNSLNRDCMVHGLWAYKTSKLASVLTFREFNRRYRALGIRALCLDPGLVNTDIGCKSTNLIERLIWDRRQRFGVSPEVPARDLVQLASLNELPEPDATYWYRSQPIAPSRIARNPRLALATWKASNKLCHISGDQE